VNDLGVAAIGGVDVTVLDVHQHIGMKGKHIGGIAQAGSHCTNNPALLAGSGGIEVKVPQFRINCQITPLRIARLYGGKVVVAATCAQSGSQTGKAPIPPGSAADGRVSGQRDVLPQPEGAGIIVNGIADDLDGPITAGTRARNHDSFGAKAHIASRVSAGQINQERCAVGHEDCSVGIPQSGSVVYLYGATGDGGIAAKVVHRINRQGAAP